MFAFQLSQANTASERAPPSHPTAVLKRPTLISALLLAVLFGLPGAAWAADPDPETMGRLADEGSAFFAEGKYEEAAEKFAAASQADPTVAALYKNEMLAWYKAGLENCHRALRAADSYVAGGGSDVNDVESVRFDCREKAARLALGEGLLDKADELLSEVDEDRLTQNRQKRYYALLGELRDAREALEADEEPDEPPPPRSNTMAIAGYSLLGVGAVSLGVGLVWFLDIAGQNSDLQDLQRTDPEAYADQVGAYNDDVKSFGTLSPVLWAVGGLAIAGGSTLLYLHYSDDGTSVSLTPLLGTGHAGARIDFRF